MPQRPIGNRPVRALLSQQKVMLARKRLAERGAKKEVEKKDGEKKDGAKPNGVQRGGFRYEEVDSAKNPTVNSLYCSNVKCIWISVKGLESMENCL